MAGRGVWCLLSGRLSSLTSVYTTKGVGPLAVRTFATQAGDGLPESVKRVGKAMAFPNEYPGQIYAFNWCLNRDGVTPLRRSAFRITKTLDLKVAGLAVPKKMPLKVKAAAASKIPEAGSENLSFDKFDEVSQQTRDLLSLSDHLFCPEGHVPGSRTGVRIITNSASVGPDLLAYLERAPRKEPPESLPITVYALEGSEFQFEGFAIEEVEAPLPVEDDGQDWQTGDGYESLQKEAKSVAAVVVAGQKLDIKVIVAGIELSQKALEEDEASRAAEKAGTETP